MNFDWSIDILIIAPLITIAISMLGIFDIKKNTTEIIFKECLQKLRIEKIKIWKKLLIIQTQSINENIFDEILEDEERYNNLNNLLQDCRKHFDTYYMCLMYMFCGGILIKILSFPFPDFFLEESAKRALSVTVFLSVLFLIFGMITLVLKKKKMEKSFENIISTSSPINLQT